LLESVLKARNAWVKVERVERGKELSVMICIKVVVVKGKGRNRSTSLMPFLPFFSTGKPTPRLQGNAASRGLCDTDISYNCSSSSQSSSSIRQAAAVELSQRIRPASNSKPNVIVSYGGYFCLTTCEHFTRNIFSWSHCIKGSRLFLRPPFAALLIYRVRSSLNVCKNIYGNGRS